jgi:hypothetical protein
MTEAQHNKGGRINFGIYYINDIYQWGYEVIDTIEKTTLKRGYGCLNMEEARKKGFEEAKNTIYELGIANTKSGIDAHKNHTRKG